MTKGDKRFVVYSTLYKSGRYASWHDCTGMPDDQARGKFLMEHSNEEDHLLKTENQQNEKRSKIIV